MHIIAPFLDVNTEIQPRWLNGPKAQPNDDKIQRTEKRYNHMNCYLLLNNTPGSL